MGEAHEAHKQTGGCQRKDEMAPCWHQVYLADRCRATSQQCGYFV